MECGEALYRHAFKQNMSRLGKAFDTNILWVTGLPGSGKTTLARYVAGEDDMTLPLDPFISLLDNAGLSEADEEYWCCVDAVRDRIVAIGQELFWQGRGLIVEGIQIYRKWLTGDVKQFFRGQPLIVLGTDRELSMRRLMERNHEDCNDEELVSWFRGHYTIEEQFLSEFLEEVGE